MSTKNIVSIVILIAIAAVFISSSTFVNPLLAKSHKDKNSEKDKSPDQTSEQSNKNKDKGTGDSSTGDSSTGDSSTGDSSTGDSSSNTDPNKSTDNTVPSSSSAQSKYDEFQKCLFNADSTKGFATNQEIKDCFGSIFNPTTGITTKDSSTPS
jgi:cytoskeletal protein RodZ